MKKRLIFTLAFLVLIFIPAYAFGSTQLRLAGNDRYETASAIAQDGWQTSNYAIIASGENYPDALSAAPLSKKYDAPILLTNSDNLSVVTKQKLLSLQVKNVFIIGGTAAVSPNVESQITSIGINVTRLTGQDRYATAIEIAKQLNSSSEIFVVTGQDYPDALSIAPIAGLKQEPIILVPKNYIPEVVKAYLTDKNIIKTYVVGNTSTIYDNVCTQFPGYERITNSDKYFLNTTINSNFDRLFTSKDICVATGERFADALTGGAYAAKKGIPIVLVNDNLPTYTRIYTNTKLNSSEGINGNLYIFGGQGAIPESVIGNLYIYKPSAPTNLVVTATTSSEVTIHWDFDSDVDWCHIYYSFDGINYKPITTNSDGSGAKVGYSVHTFSLIELQPSTTCYFKVTAIRDMAESDYSNVAKATTLTQSATTIITPTYTTPDIIESRIDGTFTGWTGDTLFKLQNGQIWQQSSFNYWYHYAYSPKVLIYKSGSLYKMLLDGYDKSIYVVRLK